MTIEHRLSKQPSSQHRRASAALQEEARQRELFAALPTAILVTTPDGLIRQANPAAVSLFGLGRRFTGLRITDLLPQIEGPEWVAPGPSPRVPGSTSGEQPSQRATWHATINRPDGVSIDVDIVRTPLDVSNLPESLLYVVHDVAKLTELSRMREQLLYDVAHELRGPLGVLENVLEILANEYADLTPQEHERLVASGRRTAARLHNLMEDLLSAGAIQSGRFSIQPTPTPVQTILSEAREAVDGFLGPRDQELIIDCPDTALPANADQRHASRLLANLLTNASKYGPEHQPIVVRIRSAGRYIRFDIEDSGPGISAEQQAGLFERFYRVRSASEAPGIGLGLAIAQGIVAAHGGEIGVESAPGQGTRVWFTLPAVTHGP